MKRVSLLIAVLLVIVLVWPTLSGFAQDTTPFIPYAANPILERGDADAWDGIEGMVFAPHVLQVNSTYYMFYSGADNPKGRPAAIGFATSQDGLEWTKYEQNPIIEPDGDGYDSMCISVAVPMVEEDGTWVLYYAANSMPCYGPGRYIGRATAPAPEGPWTRSTNPILESGDIGEWDEGFIMPHSVVAIDDGYLMYYSGGSDFLVPLPRRIGLATSPDGINWTKCDNPATIEAPCTESDPISQINTNGQVEPLDAWSVDVNRNENGFEMFFSSTCPEMVSDNCPAFLAYATSQDGIHWTTYTQESERVLMPDNPDASAYHHLSYPSALHVGEETYVYFTGCKEDQNDCEIGLAIGTIKP